MMRRAIQEVRTPWGTFAGFRRDTVTDHLVRFGAHTRNELAMLLSLLRPGDTAVDVGAHIGTFSVPMAAQVGPRGKVIALEGSAETFALLRRNVAQNGLEGRIEPHWAVVTDRPGEYQPIPRRTNSGATFFARSERQAEGPPSVVLDRWLAGRVDRLDLVKVDVEGMELRVLVGAEATIRRYRPVVYVEVNRPGLARQGDSPAGLERFLAGLGYRFFRNAGPRNSATDTYQITRLDRVDEGGAFFDLLAVHRQSDRYPHGAGRFNLAAYQARMGPRPHLPLRAIRRLGRMVAGRWR